MATTAFAYSPKDIFLHWKAGRLGKGKDQYEGWPDHTAWIGV